MATPKRPNSSDRVTYRQLRNTPGEVWERLAHDEPLTLMADGEAKAVLLPVSDGDVRGTYEAYTRGRAMLAAARIRRAAKESGVRGMTLRDINALIDKVRAARKRSSRRK